MKTAELTGDRHLLARNHILDGGAHGHHVAKHKLQGNSNDVHCDQQQQLVITITEIHPNRGSTAGENQH